MAGDSTNQELLAALRQKLGGVSLQAISARRRRIRALVAMPTDVATYIIAHREGLKIEQWLDAEKLREVAEFEAKLIAKERALDGSTSRAGRPQRRGTRATVTKEVTIGGKLKIPKGALNPQHAAEAIRMADEAYPLLYVFENSVREFIDGHLTAAYGRDWHLDADIVRRDTREKVERNRNSEAKTRYHSSRRARFIYYTDIGDLVLIYRSRKGVKVLQPLFPSDSWFPSTVEKIEASRHVVAHMNPIRRRDIDRIRINLEDWLDQVKDRQPPT